jgi:hypothetical protein
MATTDAQRQEAEQLTEEATRLHALGAGPDAIAALRRAMLLYAELERQALEREQTSPLRRGVRAQTCERYGDYLAEMEEHAGAANAYQEAVDLYGQEGGAEAAQQARACAHKALASIAALRARPQDRLYLLIAHHERQQQQLALRAGTEEQQGDCCLHIAQILLRRDRPREAVARFQAALALYARAQQTPSVVLSSAECHHRMAGLMANSLRDLAGAARHYRAAVALYTAHEPPVHGVQQECALCLHALNWIERHLENRSRETTLE